VAHVRERPCAPAVAPHDDPQKRVHAVLKRVAAFAARAVRVEA
jgi:hypothetical protein